MKENNKEEQISSIFESIIRLAQFDYSHKAKIKDDGDPLDGIAAGINMLGEQIEQLMKREEEKSILFDQSQKIAQLGSWKLNLATNQRTWSDEVYRILGFQPKEFTANYEAFIDAVHPDDRAAVKAAYYSSVMEDKDTYEIEHRVVRKDTGEIRFVYEKCEHQRDAKGNITGSLGYMQDITEWKKAEEIIAQSELRLKTAQHIAKIGSWELDFETGEVKWSDEMYKIYECDPNTFTPAVDSLIALLHPEYREAMHNWIAGAMSGRNQASLDFQLDGNSDKWIRGQGKIIFNEEGKPVKAHGTAQDITESKKTFFELSKFKEAVDTSADDIFIIDREKMLFVDCNETALKHLGYSKEELLNMGPADIKPLLTRYELAEKFDAVISSENKIGQIETPHLRKDGTQYDAEVYLRSFLFEGSAFLTASVRDVTERNKTERELEIIAEHLKEAQSIAHVGNWDINLITNKSTWSDETYRILGLDPATTIPTVEKFLSCIHPDDLAFVQGKVNDSFTVLKGETFHYRILRNDGSIVHALSQTSVDFDEQGKPLRLFGIIQDITEIKVAEEKLREYEHFFNHSNDLNSFANTEGYLEVVNPRFKSALGYSAKELSDTPVFDFIHPDDIPAAKHEMEKLKKGAITTSFVKRFRKKDGEYLWLDLHVTPNPVTGRLYAIAHDITERKKAEEEILQATRTLSLAVRAAKAGIFDWDIVNNHLKWEEQTYSLYGITPDTFNGAYESWEKCVHPDDIERGNAEVQAALLGEKEFDTEFRVIWPDSSVHYLRGIAIIERDEDGNPLRMIGTNWDITERKKDEEEILSATRNLSLAVRAGGVGIWDFDIVNNNLKWDDQMYRLYGITREAFGGAYESWKKCVHPDDMVRGNNEVQAAILGEKHFNTEFRVIWPDSSVHYLHGIADIERDADGNPLRMIGTNWDITQRRKAEEEILNATRNLSLAVRAGGIGIWEYDVINNELKWDDQMYRIYGITAETFGGAYESWKQGLHPDDVERSQAVVKAAIRDGKDFDTEFRVVWPDSSIHYVKAFAEAERNADGLVTRLIGTNYEITESKKIEEALRNTLKETSDYKLALDASSIVAITDQKGIIRHANDNFCKISKFSREELIGQDHRILNSGYHPKEFIRNMWVTIANGKIWKGEVRNKAKDGTFYWVDTTIVPFLDEKGKPFQYISIRSDITEQKNAEQALRESNDQLEHKVIERTAELSDAFETLKEKEYRLTQALRIAKLGNWEVDLATGEVLWSDEMYRIYDCDPATFTPGRKSTIGLLHPNDRKFMGKWLAAIATGNKQEALDFRIITSDGSIKFAQVDSEIIFNKEGKPFKVQGTVQDITASKLLEQQLGQSQKMQAVGTLAGGIAHDFNNLLGTIVGYATFLLRKLPENSKEIGYVKQISLAAERAAELVKQILTFSRGGDYELKPVQITSLIKESVQLLRSTLPSNIEIREHIGSNCRPILANHTQIQQMVINLFTNAVHSMEANGGTLDITAEELTFKKMANHLGLNKGTYLKLSVSDTGIGMTSEVKERIFDPFFTTKEVGKGTGLGLSMVHGIMKAHQGVITVESEPQRGTVFQLFFPIMEDGIQEEPEEPNSTYVVEAEGQSRHVLIVEDESSLADFYEVFLNDIGCQTTVASNGYAALEIFQADPNQFDLVLTDQTMPKMTGSQLSKELLKIRTDIPIVLATGYSSTISEKEAKEMGISYFLMKPVEIQTGCSSSVMYLYGKKASL